MRWFSGIETSESSRFFCSSFLGLQVHHKHLSSSLFCTHRQRTLTAAAGCDLGLSLAPLFSPSHQSIQDESNVKLGERALIMVGPTLATNLLSTGLIAWKAWYAPSLYTCNRLWYLTICRLRRQHRTSVKKHLGEGSVSVRVERIFALLVESGFVYCCLWVCLNHASLLAEELTMAIEDFIPDFCVPRDA